MAKLRPSQVKGRKKARRQVKASLRTIRAMALGSAILGLLALGSVYPLYHTNPDMPWFALVPMTVIGLYVFVVSIGTFRLNPRYFPWYYPVAFLWSFLIRGILSAYVEAIADLTQSKKRLKRLAKQENT